MPFFTARRYTDRQDWDLGEHPNDQHAVAAFSRLVGMDFEVTPEPTSWALIRRDNTDDAAPETVISIRLVTPR
jgi:hypothetical protein